MPIPGQVPLFAVMVGATLMIKSLQSMLEVAPAFSQPGTVQTARASISPNLIPKADRLTVVQREILDEIVAIPGVFSAEIASGVPMDGRFKRRSDIPSAPLPG